jgi:hypothetical protein
MINQSRNMNDELGEGSTDGVFKKNPPDRSAISHPDDNPMRMRLPWRYGVEDARGVDPTRPNKDARRSADDHYRAEW